MNPNVTHRVLAEWCAKGHGEWKHSPSSSGMVHTTYDYKEEDANKQITMNKQGQIIMVRHFGDIQWHAPTESYLESGL